MKTKLEIRALELNEKLRDLTEKEVAMMKKSLPQHYVTYNRKRYCSECGTPLVLDGKTKGLLDVCPCCGARPKEAALKRRGRMGIDSWYRGKLDTIGEFQVYRHFIFQKISEVGKRCQYDWYECVRTYFTEKGKVIMIGKNKRPFSWDLWIRDSQWGIHKCAGSWQYGTPYIVEDEIVGRKKITEWLRKRGFKGKGYGIGVNNLIKSLTKDSFLEYLLKTGQTKYVRDRKKIRGLEREWIIAKRAGYKIEDIDIWCDYIQMERNRGKITTNREICCAANIKEKHDKLCEWKRAEERKEIEEKHREWERKKILNRIEENKQYIEDKQKIRTLRIEYGDIEIRPLINRYDFILEGRKMEHCVNDNEYFKKKNSIILSVREKEGKRLATIEWSVEEGKIWQIRARKNGIVKREKEIRSIIEKNKEKLII